jgi:hypothetical protein
LSDLHPHWLQVRLAAWELRHATRAAKSTHG